MARGRILHAGSNFTTAETVIEDALGRTVAHATGSVVAVPISPPPPPFARSLDEEVDEPSYPSPDPSRRPMPASASSDGLPAAGHFLGMEMVDVSDGRVTTRMPTTEWYCNLRREIEAGVAATQATVTASLIDPGLLSPDEHAVSLEISMTFLAPVPADGRPLSTTARLVTRRDDIFVVEATSDDADGNRVVAGRGTLLVRPRRSRRARRPSNRVLLTVLFTDVVGSTEMASHVGDVRWRELLDEHHALVRRQIELHTAREVKTTGDGFLATFDSPSRAVQCARNIRDGLTRIGVAIRAGIHTGECELVEGDVAGLAVHVASRVQATAQAGEILVSSTVRDLVAGSGTPFVSRGSFALKGLDGEWTLFALGE